MEKIEKTKGQHINHITAKKENYIIRIFRIKLLEMPTNEKIDKFKYS